MKQGAFFFSVSMGGAVKCVATTRRHRINHECMKGCLIAGLLLLITVAQGWADELDFTQSLSEADFTAAGIGRLTPAERRHLDKLIAAAQQNLAADARQSAEKAQAAKQKAEEAMAAKNAAEAEARAMKAAAKHEAELSKAESVEAKASKGFFAKAKVMIVPGTKIEYAEVQSKISGKFEGWNGRTIFYLVNGQRWQVANSDERYFTPPEDDLAVEIRPAAMGGFWLYLPALKKQVRVKLLPDK